MFLNDRHHPARSREKRTDRNGLSNPFAEDDLVVEVVLTVFVPCTTDAMSVAERAIAKPETAKLVIPDHAALAVEQRPAALSAGDGSICFEDDHGCTLPLAEPGEDSAGDRGLRGRFQCYRIANHEQFVTEVYSFPG